MCIFVFMCLFLYVYVWVCVCLYVCVCVRVCVFICESVYVLNYFDITFSFVMFLSIWALDKCTSGLQLLRWKWISLSALGLEISTHSSIKCFDHFICRRATKAKNVAYPYSTLFRWQNVVNHCQFIMYCPNILHTGTKYDTWALYMRIHAKHTWNPLSPLKIFLTLCISVH